MCAWDRSSSSGPTDNSVEDFWRMIWEQRVPTVVMLTRMFEGRVSDQGCLLTRGNNLHGITVCVSKYACGCIITRKLSVKYFSQLVFQH